MNKEKIFHIGLIVLAIFLIGLIIKFAFFNSPKLTNTQKNRIDYYATQALDYCKKNDLNTNYCILVDFSQHSGKNRMFVYDFNKKDVIYKGIAVHGKGGNSKANYVKFSNVPGSNCSSEGKYRIGARSYSNWGTHVHYKLHGLESTNSNAFKRYIVLHSYIGVPSTEIYPIPAPKVSEGCPVICNELMQNIDDLLKSIKNQKPVMLWIFK
ncbi:peptidase [Ornithobacterium rhinotracheale]|uniref:murein L,D-transpeptidase catalytic domain-containing protein n=1 Tax=Ornithobacterium rhinotracheale TaxID=28251 RepID=UPI00129C92D1|nr:murein L,D-transpeptidase catalytic domain family protein [Ornithobacterium rhinotracheale]MRJ08780.1 peptidase [Ornithobacterium rhinotracheale]UOH77076.1 murein L,D-transpeptidase catalytic domain family protein [Ornithobacterium rhinotracheale]